jgi:hypothetical protein
MVIVFIALLVAGAGAAVAAAPDSDDVKPRAGTWKGKTSQGLPIKFKVERGWKDSLSLEGGEVVRAGIVDPLFETRSTCTYDFVNGLSGTEKDVAEHSLPVYRDDNGQIDGGNVYAQYRRNGLPGFVYRHFGGGSVGESSASNDVQIRGKFLSKKKAKGWVSYKQEEHNEIGDFSCASGKVRWTIRR